MDPVDNTRNTAREIIRFARERTVDLQRYCTEGHFLNEQRMIYLWRKDELPYSGPTDEPIGTLHYNMQGTVSLLPNQLKDSADAFRGGWTEAGTFDSIEQAFTLLKAWLIDCKEVDELPPRSIRRYAIC